MSAHYCVVYYTYLLVCMVRLIGSTALARIGIALPDGWARTVQ